MSEVSLLSESLADDWAMSGLVGIDVSDEELIILPLLSSVPCSGFI